MFASFLLAAAAAEVPQRPPGLVEQVTKHLLQIDVAIDGPPELTRTLKLEDFDLTVGGKSVVPVSVDRLCTDPSLQAAEPVAPTPPTSYLFYFDQRQMTMGGRNISLDVAEDLIRRLVVRGDRGSIVSSGNRVATIAPFTDSSDELVKALHRLRDMRDQFDDYASLEGSRQDEVERLESCPLARTYEREERVRASQSLQVFATVLGRFSAIEPPKVALYFGDNLRDFPGRHYREFAGQACVDEYLEPSMSFKPIHDAAAAYGVKAYAVEAQGIKVTPSIPGERVASMDAQGGLKALALDTGGTAFLGGAGVEYMTTKIDRDASCLYLLSIDPAPFPQDEPLPVTLYIRVPKVRARTRSYTIVQSESARRVSTLLAAFTAPQDVKSLRSLRPGLVPLGVVDGKLRALLQAVLSETALQGETWDLGLSLVTGADVSHQASARVTVKEQGVPIVFESVADIAPGPFEVTMVGMEDVTSDLAAGRMKAEWDYAGDLHEILGLAVLRKSAGAFVRDGVVSTSGSFVVAEDQTVRTGDALELVSLVCRPKKSKATLRVSTKLSGESSPAFPPRELSAKDGVCIQVRDVVPADTLAAGEYTYTVRIDGKSEKKSRTIRVQD